MNKFKLLDELVKAMGLTPQEIVKHWHDTGAVKSALFSRSQAKSRKTKSKQTSDPKREPKPKPAKNSLLHMSEEDIFEVLKKIIAEQAGVEEDEVLRDSKLVHLGVDSLDLVEITMTVENMFGISIPDADVRDDDTVQDIVEYLAGRKVMINAGVPIIS